MAERPEDLNLPVAVINRLVKETLPEGVNVSKEARAAIAKAASVFVLFATSCANNFALKAKRKTLTGQDVMAAMTDMDFDKFVAPLQESLEIYRQGQKGRKDALERRKQKDASGTELETLESEDVEEEGLEGGDEEEGDGDGDNDVSNRSAGSSDNEEADDDNMDADNDASK